MKKLLFLLTFIPAYLFAQNTQVPGFTINGKIAGLPNGSVKIMSTQQDGSVIATGSSNNGDFTVKGSIPEPGLYFLVLGNEQPEYIFLEDRDITVTGSKNDLKNLK